MHDVHTSRALHNDIAESLAKMLAMFKRVIVALLDELERFKKADINGLRCDERFGHCI